MAPALSSNELETLWRRRLREAHLRLEFARNSRKEVQRDFLNEPSRDGRYAYGSAIHFERLARQEYRHLQQILWDLTVNGKVPDEEEWQRRDGTRVDVSLTSDGTRS